jgi:raffinose/stachyose/melibiose transport system permease protein
LAYALNLRLRLRNLYRTALFMPVVISSVVVGFTWGYIYSPKLGLLSNALQSVGLGGLDRAWLGDPNLAIYSVIAVAIWHQLGGAVVIYLAAMQAIPQELFESAAMDGANGWQRMIHIAIPLTLYTTAVLVILNLIAAVKSFDLVYLLTRGGPYHASEVMAVGVYQQAFAVHHMGYAAALSVVLLLIAALVTVVQLRLYGRSDSAS